MDLKSKTATLHESLKIKVCGMRERHNLEKLVQLPIDYVGFIFYALSPRYVGDNFSTETSGLVPDNINKAGVFVNETLSEVQRQAEKHRLQYIQLHGSEIPDYCMFLREKGYKVIKAFKAEASMLTCETADYRFACDYFLFDTPTPAHGGSGQKFDWQMLQQQKLYLHFFLSGGIAPGDEQTIKTLGINGLCAIDLNSRFETSPGLKDIDKIKTFVSTLKAQ